jgi:P27 family predicted phage terminase small subunit
MKTFSIDLSALHPKAKKQMDDIIKYLAADKSIKVQDYTALTLLSNSFSVYYQAIDILNKDGLVIEDLQRSMQPSLPGMEPAFLTKLRSTKPHPALKIANDAQYQITKLLIEFQLTPRSRKKVNSIGSEIEPLSPADKLLSRNKKEIQHS